MNLEAIDIAFAKVIRRRGTYKQLRLKKNTVTQYRWRLKNGRKISLDKKIQVLLRSGHNFGEAQYTEQDLISIIHFILRSGRSASQLGAGYLLEKWKRS